MSAPQIQCPAGASDTGAYRIEWHGSDDVIYRLVETNTSAPAPERQVLYEGPERASTVSGRPDGVYRYEVGIVEAQQVTSWSEPCEVTVDTPELSTALAIFGVGLAVVLTTIITILRGHRAHQRGEIG